MNNKILAYIAVIVGIVFLLSAGIYLSEPARSLPNFFPGYSPLLTKHHYTHAVGALVLGLVVFAFAWFQSGKKSSK